MAEYFAQQKIPSWQGDAVFLVLNTGLRRSEILHLDWGKNVYLDNEQIIFSGKGDKDRVVPLNNDAVKILLNRPRNKKDTRVFWEIGSKDAINSMWKKMRTRTGLTGTFHELRKTFALWVINGGSLEHLREILGHEDYDTVKIYATLSPESVHKYKNVISFDQKRFTGT
jgi:integrase/recombinase XerD